MQINTAFTSVHNEKPVYYLATKHTFSGRLFVLSSPINEELFEALYGTNDGDGLVVATEQRSTVSSLYASSTH